MCENDLVVENEWSEDAEVSRRVFARYQRDETKTGLEAWLQWMLREHKFEQRLLISWMGRTWSLNGDWLEQLNIFRCEGRNIADAENRLHYSVLKTLPVNAKHTRAQSPWSPCTSDGRQTLTQQTATIKIKFSISIETNLSLTVKIGYCCINHFNM